MQAMEKEERYMRDTGEEVCVGFGNQMGMKEQIKVTQRFKV